MTAFRGGFDEMKVHLGIRNIHSIRSEAERGREWLERRAGFSTAVVASVILSAPHHLYDQNVL